MSVVDESNEGLMTTTEVATAKTATAGPVKTEAAGTARTWPSPSAG